MKANPIELEIFKNRFSSVAEQMGKTLMRTAYSSNIKERRDFSCAIFDRTGGIVAQASHIPVHLGSMPMSVMAAISSIDFDEDDMVILNDPFKGGTHLPDITLVAPVYYEDNGPVLYVANRAHHADVGGISPGSMPVSESILQEGVIIEPQKYIKKGRINTRVHEFILSSVRTPQERDGDLAAQVMANITGIVGLRGIMKKNSLAGVEFLCRELIEYSRRITEKTISGIPDGQYVYEDYLDPAVPGDDKGAIIHVKLEVAGNRMKADFSRSAPQVSGCLNAVYAITLSCVLYVVRSLSDVDIPANAGCLVPVEVVTKKGTIVDAVFPAAVAGGNVETSQRIVDVLLGALSLAIPKKNSCCIPGYDE